VRAEDLGTLSDVLFYLERCGVKKDEAAAIIERVFCWGVSAAMARQEFRPLPADAPELDPAQSAQLSLLTKPPPKKKKTNGAVMVKRSIPDDFLLNDSRSQYATERGFSGQQTREMFDEFRDWYRKTGKRWSDWEAVWRDWVRRQIGKINDRTDPIDRRLS